MQLDTNSSLDRRSIHRGTRPVNSKEKIFIEMDLILLHFSACKNVESNIARARATKIYGNLQSEYLEIQIIETSLLFRVFWKYTRSVFIASNLELTPEKFFMFMECCCSTVCVLFYLIFSWFR